MVACWLLLACFSGGRWRVTNGLSLQRLQGMMAFAFSFNRPLYCLLFWLYRIAADDTTELFRLSKWPANELILSSVLGILSIVDVQKKYLPTIYSVDASEAAGGVVSAHLGEGGENVSCELWHRARRVRHGPIRLLNPSEASLKHIGFGLDGELEPDEVDLAAARMARAASSTRVVLATWRSPRHLGLPVLRLPSRHDADESPSVGRASRRR